MHLAASTTRTAAMANGRQSDLLIEGELSLHKSRSLLAMHQELDQILSTIEQKAKQGPIEPHQLTTLISTARACISADDDFVNRRNLSILVPERCPSHATGLAQRVFDIPELLEHILRYLEIPALLEAQRINRQFRDAVETSTRLQRKLSLLPHSSRTFYAPFALRGLASLKCRLIPSGTRKMGESERSLHFVLEARFYGPLPKIGSRCRRMLIMQPPVTSVKVYQDCCHARSVPSDSPFILSNPSGISIGDLLRTAQVMRTQHRQCPHAAAWRLDENGDVRVSTRFRAELVLDPTDQLVQDRIEIRRFRQQGEAEEKRKNVMMAAFAATRLSGKIHSQSVSNLLVLR